MITIPQSRISNLKSEKVEPLPGRELEILHLIAEGHSNAEISQRLYLALSTVKGHNLRIFNKLQVQNRTEAVARARELGLNLIPKTILKSILKLLPGSTFLPVY